MFAPWVMVLIAGSCIVTVTLGIRQVFGLFMVPISNELGTGLQTFSLAIAAQNLLWGASSPLFGALADRIGAWKVAALGALIYSAGLLFTALMVTEAGIFLGQILIGIGMGSAGISIAIGAVARAVPPEKRSLAFGMVTSFGSFGQFALLPITQLLIGGYGWQMALIILSVLMGAMMAVALGMRSDKPGSTRDVAAVTTGEALQLAVRSRDYLLLTTGVFCLRPAACVHHNAPACLSEGPCDFRQYSQLDIGAGRAVQHSGGFCLRMAGRQIIEAQNAGNRLSASADW
jgi:MFS family permease